MPYIYCNTHGRFRDLEEASPHVLIEALQFVQQSFLKTSTDCDVPEELGSALFLLVVSTVLGQSFPGWVTAWTPSDGLSPAHWE